MDPSASCVPESYNKVKLKETDRKKKASSPNITGEKIEDNTSFL
jgi:hypothetical protein